MGRGGVISSVTVKAANIDVAVLYLSERLNNNLCYIILSFSTLFFSHKRNLLNAATGEKKTKSLIIKFFILIKVQILVKIYY